MKPDELQEEEPITTQEPVNEAEIQTEESPEMPQEEVSELDKAYIELAEMKDKYLRLYADFENFRRRTAKERLELMQTAGEDVIVAMLPLWDDIDRASATFDANTETVDKVGVELIFNKFKTTLGVKGVKQIEAKGQDFNVDMHESITQFPAPTEDLKGKVIDEIERGYTLNDKVIRFAKVVVGM